MIRWEVAHLLADAAERAARIPRIRRSMRGHEANEVGVLGELVALDYFRSLGLEVEHVDTANEDFLVEGLTVDVKAKERSVAPRPNYTCTVPDLQIGRQDPDAYLFVSLTRAGEPGGGVARFGEAWILGSLLRQEFLNRATHYDAGDHDPSNGWTTTIPCWQVEIRDLRPPRTPTAMVGNT